MWQNATVSLKIVKNCFWAACLEVIKSVLYVCLSRLFVSPFFFLSYLLPTPLPHSQFYSAGDFSLARFVYPQFPRVISAVIIAGVGNKHAHSVRQTHNSGGGNNNNNFPARCWIESQVERPAFFHEGSKLERRSRSFVAACAKQKTARNKKEKIVVIWIHIYRGGKSLTRLRRKK